jgi:uncharacterized integral membrane protein
MHDMSLEPDSGAPPTPAEQKKTLLMLVAMVAAVHSIAIAVYYGLHVADRPLKTQQVFVGAWVIATLIVITPMMKRIRRARRRMSRKR